ncbi:MAG: Rne/Rng family ribonuclease, partial [Pseudomonadota bacterium]|nr:Rne/Rng family ribonuclease [Pseudomonadota bacterium]
TVLMPNSSHGGGISRKISSASDRKRLKQVVSDLSLPRTMGLIVRTAGLSRTKPEIKRDFDYLARLWDEIRERTLSSSAPALIHSDSDLIKRAIRDIYNREIEEVVVEGEDGYKSAKQFMKLLMPSHARRVKQYSDPVPLFQRYGAEDQLKAMYDPVVQLKSGGYLVINPTEALVSIDINSGRSTKEHNIEQTALHTNLEAAREIARQLRLRDMAGLVVIDFIDQEHHSNTRKVEKAMKEALKNDRARIQVGRISSFGLMEMSRQRLRTGVLEATTRECPHCDGTGLVRTASSAGLSALRLIEDEAAKGKGSVIRLAASTEAAVYLLNEKRAELMEIEQRYHVTVEVVPEGEDEGAKMTVSSHGPKPKDAPRFDPIVDDEIEDEVVDESDDEDSDDGSDDRPRKKRRRRRGGRGRNKSRDRNDEQDGDDSDDSDDDAEADRGESG